MPISLEEAFDTLADDDQFSAIIDRFGERLGAPTYAGGWASNDSVEQLVCFSGFEEAVVERYLTEYAHRDPWTSAMLRDPVYGEFVNMLDRVDSDTFASSALYRELFVPTGTDVFYAAAFMMLTDDTQSGLTFHRGRKAGEFDRTALAEVNRDAGDLTRLFHLKVRYARLFQRAGNWDRLLSRIDVELYVVGRNGRLIDCNEIGQDVLSDRRGLFLRAGRLHASDASSQKSLERVFAAALDDRLEATDGFTVCHAGGKRRLLVLPMKNPGGSLRIALIGETARHLTDDLGKMLRASYGLSPVEASLMIRLANGESPKEISQDRSVSLETTRTQYRSAMRKMDCKSLTDAIIAIRRLPVVRASAGSED